MSEACPRCGAGVRPWCDESEPTEDRLFWCGRLERVIKGRTWDVIEGETCLRRQLAQRNERLDRAAVLLGERELASARDRARIKELEADLAAVAPVVRAVMDWEIAERQYTHRTTPEPGVGDWAWLVAKKHVLEAEVRALPADLLERMGVDRG